MLTIIIVAILVIAAMKMIDNKIEHVQKLDKIQEKLDRLEAKENKQNNN